MSTLKTTADVIAALGGTGQVARLLGKNQNTVCNWVSRRKFPPETFLVVQELLKERHLSAPPALWGMVVPNSTTRRKAPRDEGCPTTRVA